jgi:hypothetical protein
VEREDATVESAESLATMLAGCLRNFIEIARSARQEDLAMACKMIERDVKESDNMKDRVFMTHGLIFLDCRVMCMRNEAIEGDLVKAG